MLRTRRWKLVATLELPALVCLTLLLAARPLDAETEQTGAAPGSGAEQPRADIQNEASDVGNSQLGKEVTADGSRLFQFHPIWNAGAKLKDELGGYGLTYTLEMAFYDQYASQVIAGQKNYATYSWRFSGSWRFLRSQERGAVFFDATLLGSPGLNYDPSAELITRSVGSISELNGSIYPDPVALDEVLIKYVSPSTRYGGSIGKLDPSNRFDTNRVANDPFRAFTALALENNLSIPWPDYGGLGAFIHADFGEHHYVMAATGASDVGEPFGFGDGIGDGNLYQFLEIGTQIEVPSLGVGHFRLTPWHSRTLGRGGWGVGFNFDQELFHPDVVSFFRFGIGEPSATPVQTFVSGGVTWLHPWGRVHDMLGLGIAWTNPSPGEGFRNETLIEVFYRFAILPWIQLSPNLQIVRHPANEPSTGTVLVPGIRLYLSL